MKISILLSVVILTIGICFHFAGSETLSKLRSTHQQLTVEARSLGITIDTPDSEVRLISSERLKNTVIMREFERAEIEAKDVANEILDYAKLAIEMRGRNENPTPEMQTSLVHILDKISSLSELQLKTVIEEMLGASDLDDEARSESVMFTILVLAERKPEEAFTLMVKFKDSDLKQSDVSRVLKMSLEKWAMKDPNAATEWVRQNAEQYPELLNESARSSLLTSMAKNDMKKAFSHLSELSQNKSKEILEEIGSNVTSKEDRVEFVNLLRKYVESQESEERQGAKSAIASLTTSIANDGFDEGRAWMKSHLSDEEISQIAMNMNYWSIGDEKGKWIEWVGDTLPEDQNGEQVAAIFKSWANEDYYAAGEWLGSLSKGEIKTVAVQSYVDVLSSHEPEAAIAWALSITEEDKKRDSLNTIYRKWPRDAKQQEARQAFAKKYNIPIQ